MGCLLLRTHNLWIENLKLFSFRAGFPNVFIFSAEPKKPEQDLKALKSAGTSNTSEKALEQGRGWESQCPFLQKAHCFIPSSLECPQLFMRSSLTLVTHSFTSLHSTASSPLKWPHYMSAWNRCLKGTGLLRAERTASPFHFCLCFGWVQASQTSKACVAPLCSFLCRTCALQTLCRSCEGGGHPACGSTGNS